MVFRSGQERGGIIRIPYPVHPLRRIGERPAKERLHDDHGDVFVRVECVELMRND